MVTKESTGCTEVLLLRNHEVRSLVSDNELELIDLIGEAYLAHATGKTSLPTSTFLQFPWESGDRIIALPAFLGSEPQVAGIKWIASFPRNIGKGWDRASAVLILNSIETGRPTAILEASVISAKRTAASAALAAKALHVERPVLAIGLIGCGMINFETAQFLRIVFPEVVSAKLFDSDSRRAEEFRQKQLARSPNWEVTIAKDHEEVLREAEVVSIATTATVPHMHSLGSYRGSETVLHLSLRDISPEVLLQCDNVVDDPDHVCRARTSLDLAEQMVGHRQFIRATLGDVLLGRAPGRFNSTMPVIFSPFGLGILDLAVARWVVRRAVEREMGTVIDSFLPEGHSW